MWYRLIFLLAAATASLAQPYPASSVRIYTSEVGGGVDIVARIVADDIEIGRAHV